ANASVAQACCGADGICGTAGDESLAGLGWDLGSCPNVESGACTAAIGGVADVPPCFTCVDVTAVDRVASWSFGPQGPAPAPAPGRRRRPHACHDRRRGGLPGDPGAGWRMR